MTQLLINTPDLMKIIDAGYEAGAEEGAKFPVRLSAIGACPRRLACELRGVEKRAFSPRSLRVFEQGHQRGAALLAAFRQGWEDWITTVTTMPASRFRLIAELEVWMPTRIVGANARKIMEKALAWADETDDGLPLALQGEEDRLMIRGRCDLVIMDIETDDVWIIDFKTKASWGFKKLEDEGNGFDYEMQLLAYGRALRDEGKTVRGLWLYYEDHDKRGHKVLPVDPASNGLLSDAVNGVERVLLSWLIGDDFTSEPAAYAVAEKFGKKQHVGAVATLPWQCNYCSVGPEVGKCVESFRLEDIRKPGADVPRWEILDRD